MLVLFLLALGLAPLGAQEKSENLFDEYCLVENPQERYPIPKEGEAVIGSQKAFYSTPYDLRPGNFNLNVPAIQEATDDYMEVESGNGLGRWTYRITPQEKPTAAKVELRDRKSNFSNQTPWSQVKEVKGADRGMLVQMEITEILTPGKAFMAKINFGGEELNCRVDIVKEEVKRLPQVHSRLYGPHLQHAFDVWLPEGDGPFPAVVFIHGGGWGALDKTNQQIVNTANGWNERGIAFVGLNYRYTGGYQDHPAMKIPVAACLLDAARGIQYIRYHAKELKLDTDRLCLTGGSAGGATSAWLAMVDDLADPDSPDPIARMSTRVACSVPQQAQTSLDPKQMREWIPQITYGAHAFFTSSEMPKKGEERFEFFLSKREEIMPYIKDFSAYEQVSADDPPMLLVYGGQDDILPAKDTGNATHHPQFGFHLYQKLKELGVECYFWAGTQYGKPGYVKAEKERYHGWPGVANFVVDQFGMAE
ncbi:MAG: alpha/beta hydrolase fold domain-containing protein [Candidatus Sumerlaeia bacterium]